RTDCVGLPSPQLIVTVDPAPGSVAKVNANCPSRPSLAPIVMLVLLWVGGSAGEVVGAHKTARRICSGSPPCAGSLMLLWSKACLEVTSGQGALHPVDVSWACGSSRPPGSHWGRRSHLHALSKKMRSIRRASPDPPVTGLSQPLLFLVV